MKHLDFLSSSPRIYLLNEKRGKNKLGGFFSIIFVLAMIALIIYYFYIYYYVLEFNLIYYKDNWSFLFYDKQLETLKKGKSFFFDVVNNPNNATIIPILEDHNHELKPAEKCKIKPDSDIFSDDAYCFDLAYSTSLNQKINEGNRSLYLYCTENCNKSNGEPAEVDIVLLTTNLKINHSNENPLIEKGFSGFGIKLTINNRIDVEYRYIFTPILYNSTEILNTKIKSRINTYLNSLQEISLDLKDRGFASFSLDLSYDCDVYIREYRTLLDILSKIGGLFSPVKLLFEILVYFYSDFEINSEITKNVFSKIKNYEYKQINNIQNEPNLDIEDIKKQNENKLVRKKFNINKGEQYFCSFFNFCCKSCKFCKTHRTMKILNSCSDLVETYLSAENILFNMILFENYYKENPITYNENSYLNKIYLEIEDQNIFGDNEKNEEKGKKEESETLISLDSKE